MIQRILDLSISGEGVMHENTTWEIVIQSKPPNMISTLFLYM